MGRYQVASCPPEDEPPTVTGEVGSAATADTDAPWLQLWQRLRTLLRRRIRSAHDVEDIAAETMRRVFVRFQTWPSWEDVWAWAVRVARSIVVHNWRRAVRVRLETCSMFGAIPASGTGPAESGRAQRIIQSLQLHLHAADRHTLTLLEDGVFGNEEIARLRGVTLRAVQHSRQRIREQAARIGNLCRPLHP